MSRSTQRNLYDSDTGILRNWALLREIGRRKTKGYQKAPAPALKAM